MTDERERFERIIRDYPPPVFEHLNDPALLDYVSHWGWTLDQYVDPMKAHNRDREDEWLADYAKRKGKPLDVVRDEVYAERRRIQEHIHYAVTHGLC